MKEVFNYSLVNLKNQQQKVDIYFYYLPGPTFEHEIFSRDRKEDINMVLLGKSGIGKSTWINSFFNFLMFENFESVLHSKKLYVPIHTKFQHADMSREADSPEGRLVTIEIGEGENLCHQYKMGSVTASSTDMPVSHIVEPKDNGCSLIHI